MKKSKIYVTLVLLAVIVFISVYGSRSADDSFVFGKSRVYCAGSVITLKTPFELAVDGKQSDLSQNNSDSVVAAGSDGNLEILVFGYKADENTSPEIILKEQCELLKTNENISDLHLNVGNATVGNINAHTIDATFNESLKKGNVNLVVKSYIFQQNKTVWKVIYQYEKNNEVVSLLMNKLDGKITNGFTF